MPLPLTIYLVGFFLTLVALVVDTKMFKHLAEPGDVVVVLMFSLVWPTLWAFLVWDFIYYRVRK